jgi:hypothetical protein
MTLYTKTVNRQTLQTAVLKWFPAEEFSFEQETALANCAASQAIAGLLDVGTVMGKQTAGTPGSATANAGNTGNGTVGAVTAQAGIQNGTYSIEFLAATKYNVIDPSGKIVGEGATGTAFANQLGFTITAGGTAFAAGDGFTIVVAAGSGKVVPLNPTATDGSAVAMGVVVKQTTVPSGSDASVLLVERQAVLLTDGLIWPSGITGTQQAAALAQLAAAGIICRPS